MGENSKRRGLMLILSSPSGAGKTTLSRNLLENDLSTELSISMTTRPPRPGEIDGQDYYFVDEKAFKSAIENDGFLEFAEVFGNYYGTPKEKVLHALENGMDVLFDIDWQGTQQILQQEHSDVVSIFILPPTIEALRDRLKNRGQDTEDQIEDRMKTAHGEISHWAEYDYVLINDDFEKTLNKIKLILQVERKKRIRQSGLVDFVKDLMSQSLD